MSGRQSRLQRRAGAASAGVAASASNVTQRGAVRKYLMRLNLRRSYCRNDTTRFVMDSTADCAREGTEFERSVPPKLAGALSHRIDGSSLRLPGAPSVAAARLAYLRSSDEAL